MEGRSIVSPTRWGIGTTIPAGSYASTSKEVASEAQEAGSKVNK